jgi:hypothetical protein
MFIAFSTNLHEFSKIHKYQMKIHVWFYPTFKKLKILLMKCKLIISFHKWRYYKLLMEYVRWLSEIGMVRYIVIIYFN